MGWNLPPGCTDADIDRACNGDESMPKPTALEIAEAKVKMLAKDALKSERHQRKYKEARAVLKSMRISEAEILRDALARISRISNTDPFRTFDGMVQDMGLIDDIARAAIAKAEGKR